MARHKMPNYPYVQARNVGGKQKPTAIVLHLSNTTSEKGAALGVANYHHRFDAPHKSYHYIVDESKIYRCVPINVASYGNPYQAINILLCMQPQEVFRNWLDSPETKALAKAVDLIADLMLAYRIPARNLTGVAEQKWFKRRWRRRGGLILRIRGDWPRNFIDDVAAAMIVKTM